MHFISHFLFISFFQELTEALRMKIKEERKEREVECSDDAVRMHVPVLTTTHTPLVTSFLHIISFHFIFFVLFLFFVFVFVSVSYVVL
jgi:hypothetical protein